MCMPAHGTAWAVARRPETQVAAAIPDGLDHVSVEWNRMVVMLRDY